MKWAYATTLCTDPAATRDDLREVKTLDDPIELEGACRRRAPVTMGIENLREARRAQRMNRRTMAATAPATQPPARNRRMTTPPSPRQPRRPVLPGLPSRAGLPCSGLVDTGAAGAADDGAPAAARRDTQEVPLLRRDAQRRAAGEVRLVDVAAARF